MPLFADPVKSVAFTSMSVGAERRAIVALLTAFALLVQALIPSLSSAAPVFGSEVGVCTGLGLSAAPTGSDPDHTMPGHTCQHCICTAINAALPAFGCVFVVAYFPARSLVTATPHGVRPLARAPPRPLGQGPPLFSA